MNTHRASRGRWVLLGVGLMLLSVVGFGYVQAGGVAVPLGLLQSTDNLPPTKRAFVEMVNATEIAALTVMPTAPRDPNYRPRPTSIPRRPVAPRITEGYEPPLSGELFTSSNEWGGTVVGVDIEIYAGLMNTESPPQGVLVMDGQPLDDQLPHWREIYLAPVPAGKLRITSFQGTRLTVVDTTSPKQFIFDVVARHLTLAP